MRRSTVAPLTATEVARRRPCFAFRQCPPCRTEALLRIRRRRRRRRRRGRDALRIRGRAAAIRRSIITFPIVTATPAVLLDAVCRESLPIRLQRRTCIHHWVENYGEPFAVGIASCGFHAIQPLSRGVQLCVRTACFRCASDRLPLRLLHSIPHQFGASHRLRLSS